MDVSINMWDDGSAALLSKEAGRLVGSPLKVGPVQGRLFDEAARATATICRSYGVDVPERTDGLDAEQRAALSEAMTWVVRHHPEGSLSRLYAEQVLETVPPANPRVPPRRVSETVVHLHSSRDGSTAMAGLSPEEEAIADEDKLSFVEAMKRGGDFHVYAGSPCDGPHSTDRFTLGIARIAERWPQEFGAVNDAVAMDFYERNGDVAAKLALDGSWTDSYWTPWGRIDVAMETTGTTMLLPFER